MQSSTDHLLGAVNEKGRITPHGQEIAKLPRIQPAQEVAIKGWTLKVERDTRGLMTENICNPQKKPKGLMVSDNTVLNPGADGDSARAISRLANGDKVKTQVVQLELGGASANAEVLITAGQQVMATSVPVVLASNQTALPVVASVASNNWGQSLALTAGATGTLASIASSVAGYQIKGFVAHGTGDGYFVLQVASVTVLSGRIRSTLPTLPLVLPNGIAVATGSLVTLKVTNESGSTADYEATLLGS